MPDTGTNHATVCSLCLYVCLSLSTPPPSLLPDFLIFLFGSISLSLSLSLSLSYIPPAFYSGFDLELGQSERGEKDCNGGRVVSGSRSLG